MQTTLNIIGIQQKCVYTSTKMVTEKNKFGWKPRETSEIYNTEHN